MKFFKSLLQNLGFKNVIYFIPKISKARVRASKTPKKNFRLRRAFVPFRTHSLVSFKLSTQGPLNV